jgi:ankyrin repeat protein
MQPESPQENESQETGQAEESYWGSAREKQNELDSKLWSAAASGDFKKGVKLLAKGADPKSRNASGATALMWAAYSNSGPLVEAIAPRCELDAQDEDGATALMWAARSRSPDAAKALLAAGANSRLAEKYGRTALMLAAHIGSLDMVEILARKSDIWQTDRDGRSAEAFVPNDRAATEGLREFFRVERAKTERAALLATADKAGATGAAASSGADGDATASAPTRRPLAL